MSWQVGALVVGVAGSVAAPPRVRGWLAASVVAIVTLVLGIVPWSTFTDALDALASPLAFLLLAVPLAVLLDAIGFFASAAAVFGGTRHLRVALWAFAAAVTVLFNLDAAVVLLTPLYVHIARRHGDDPMTIAFIPALVASLASSVLPVSNLTNLVFADQLGLGIGDFLVHAAPAAIAATIVGWFCYRRIVPPAPPVAVVVDPVDPHALRVGLPIVVGLLVGFTFGDLVGVPAWAVAACALAVLIGVTRTVPFRHVPLAAAALALALGVLALGAAAVVDVDRVLTVAGRPGEALAFGATVLTANAVNNLPAVLVALPVLDAQPQHVWAVLLGANVGPTLWVTGALSTLLWQSTMARLGFAVSARRYASVGVRVGLPALATALAVLLVTYSG